MRETLAAAAKHLLTQPVGTKSTIVINVNDGLTGLAPGTSARTARLRDTEVHVIEATRADGKKRVEVKSQPKGTLLATSTWK